MNYTKFLPQGTHPARPIAGAVAVVVLATLGIGWAQERSSQSYSPKPWETRIEGNTNPDAIPYATVGFGFFQSVIALGAKNPGADVRKVRDTVAVDDQKARAFVEYMKASVQTITELWRQQIDTLCNRDSDLNTIPLLAPVFEEHDSELQARREELVRNSESVLGSKVMQQLDAYLNGSAKRGFVLLKRDYAKWMSGTNQDPKRLVVELCNSRPLPADRRPL